jgi:hypothetical protein
MQISYRVIEEPEDVQHITADIEKAYQTGSTFVFIIGRAPV